MFLGRRGRGFMVGPIHLPVIPCANIVLRSEFGCMVFLSLPRGPCKTQGRPRAKHEVRMCRGEVPGGWWMRSMGPSHPLRWCSRVLPVSPCRLTPFTSLGAWCVSRFQGDDPLQIGVGRDRNVHILVVCSGGKRTGTLAPWMRLTTCTMVLVASGFLGDEPRRARVSHACVGLLALLCGPNQVCWG